MLNILLFIFSFFPFMCAATDLKPWFGREYEFEIRTTLLYQNYDSLAIPHHSSEIHTANDVFLTLSVAYPFRRYCGEFEATAAHTHHQHYRWDNFRVTGRYQWMDETDGCPFSLVTGITITEPYSRALHDISSFHHGHIEVEAHLSFGKKYGYPCSQLYLFRWWNVIGIGKAEEDDPWYREEVACEFAYDTIHQFRGFIHALWGAGGKHLRPHDFRGYGDIKHRSIDLGVRYSYTLDCWGTLSLQYARRVYARNFPADANLVTFEYYFPFNNFY